MKDLRDPVIEFAVFANGSRSLAGLAQDFEGDGGKLVVIEAAGPGAQPGFRGHHIGPRRPQPGMGLEGIDQLLLDQIVPVSDY